MIRRRNKAKILVIEGADRSGKETQTKLLQEYLFNRSFNVSEIEIPKYSSLTGKLIRRMLNNGSAQSLKHTFQIVQFINKFMVQTVELPDVRSCNDFVIFDRWSLSSVIYGKATGIDDEFVYTLYDRLIEPDCTIILCGSTYAKNEIDSYEADDQLQIRVKHLYREWARVHQKNCILVDTEGKTPEEISKKIIYELKMKRVLDPCEDYKHYNSEKELDI